MSEFKLPLASRDRSWLELRERLARAARDLHFSAVANDTGSGPTLLMIAGNLAGLALSIPMHPTQTTSGALVDAQTLFATQILQRGMQMDDDAAGDDAAVYSENK